MIDVSTNTPKGNGKIMQCSIATDCMRLPLHSTSIVKKVIKPMDIAFLTYFLIPYRSKKKYLVGSTMRKQCKANWIGYQIVIKNNFAGLGMESGRMSSYPLMDYVE